MQRPRLASTAIRAPRSERLDPHYKLPASLSPRGRIAVLIDGLSLFYAALQLDITLDYGALLRFLARDGQLVHALFYTGVDVHHRQVPSGDRRGFLPWLRHQGYRVITKDVQHFPDGSKKLDIDVEMAIDMMRFSEVCDTLVLVSSDEALAYALKVVGDRGVRSEVVSLSDSVSDRLLDVADVYVDLRDIKATIQLR